MPRDAKSDKAKKTRSKMLEAAARCLEEEGVFAFSTNRVAAAADVSIGSLYQYFSTKEALLHALIQQDHTQALAALDAVQGTEGNAVTTITDLAIANATTSSASGLKTHLAYFEATLPTDPQTDLLRDRRLAYLVEVLAEHRVSDPERIAAEIYRLTDALVDVDTQNDASDMRLRAAIAGYLAIIGLEDA